MLVRYLIIIRKIIFYMLDTNARDAYAELGDRISIPNDRMNEIAMMLLNAPNDHHITRGMRLQRVLDHNNISREVFDKILTEFSYSELTPNNSNIIHNLLTNENTRLADVVKLYSHAEQNGTTAWFEQVLHTTLEFYNYQLNVNYNGAQLIEDEELRTTMLTCIDILEAFKALTY